MKVTIEGNLNQVYGALGLPPATPRSQRLAENKAAREEFAARRKVVVDAFKLARGCGATKEMTDLLEAIRRTGGVTDGDLNLARQVLAGSLSNGEL